jgi:probable phosphoglycerate mutase
MTRLSGLPSERMTEILHCDNTAVSCVDWDGYSTPRIQYIGCNEHLGPLSTLGRQHWWRGGRASFTDISLGFSPARLPEDGDLVVSFRKDAWVSVYNDIHGFNESSSRAYTMKMAAAHPRAVVFAMKGDVPSGLLELDTQAETPEGTGHISLIYLVPEDRGHMLGAQLIGHAVSVYRSLGRRTLHLRVAERNISARHFYEKMGFVEQSRESALYGSLITMQKPISVDVNW